MENIDSNHDEVLHHHYNLNHREKRFALGNRDYKWNNGYLPYEWDLNTLDPNSKSK